MFRGIRLVVYLCWIAGGSVPSTSAKQIALSFDDAPRTAEGYLSGPQRASKLIQSLRDNGVPQVAFFSVTQHLDREGKARLQRYSDAGHIIANHTHTHPDLNNTNLADYLTDIQAAERALKSYPTFKKWFRFPYLREGDTREKRDGVRKFLVQNGYLNAYITLNNYDWSLEQLFQRAIGKGIAVDLAAAERLYVDVMMQGIEFYDGLAVEYLMRSPKHVLLLHENDMAALFVGALVQRLRTEGWEIIPIDTAYRDGIANYQIDRPLRFNPGRIGELAMDAGRQKGLWHSSLDEAYLRARFERDVLRIPGE